jgi:hypothetical protein
MGFDTPIAFLEAEAKHKNVSKDTAQSHVQAFQESLETGDKTVIPFFSVERIEHVCTEHTRAERAHKGEVATGPGAKQPQAIPPKMKKKKRPRRQIGMRSPTQH